MSDRSSTSNRSAAMARCWATRKANAALVQQWWDRPVCLCGCGTELSRNSLRFAQGHDAKLKGCLRAVLRGESKRQDVPAIARAMKEHIKFLEGNPELAKAL
jgi:hypothetical protein